jgi:hypothetical protein
MMMEPFYSRFPIIAQQETRCVIIPKKLDAGLPEGEYFFTESFCNDLSCDCRRAFINIIYEDEIVATIGYGWEALDFYKKWMGNSYLINNLKGPVLEKSCNQSKYAEILLDLFKNVMLEDQVFINRLKDHYQLFKSGLKKRKMGRNESCHCGSGIKYKKCCLTNDKTKNNPY